VRAARAHGHAQVSIHTAPRRSAMTPSARRTLRLVATHLATLLATLAAPALHAQSQGTDHGAHHGSGQAAVAVPAAAPAAPGTQDPNLVAGEVRRVDPDAGKLTLRHGPIPNLDMPDMTMVFRVSDPKLLAGLKPGDKVRFTAEKIGGQYTVTSVAPAN
jgi:Cu/Ag efflux protein CusF